MKIVAKCPFCTRKIRFPINKGKLLLRCPKCKNQFMFDPNIKRIAGILIGRIQAALRGIKSTIKRYIGKQ